MRVFLSLGDIYKKCFLCFGNCFSNAQSSCPSRQLLIQKYAKMTAVDEANSSLAIKCLDFCQALTSQGMEINFSLNVGSTFSFSLDTRPKVPLALDSKKKCQTQSRLLEKETLSCSCDSHFLCHSLQFSRCHQHHQE